MGGGDWGFRFEGLENRCFGMKIREEEAGHLFCNVFFYNTWTKTTSFWPGLLKKNSLVQNDAVLASEF